MNTFFAVPLNQVRAKFASRELRRPKRRAARAIPWVVFFCLLIFSPSLVCSQTPAAPSSPRHKNWRRHKSAAAAKAKTAVKKEKTPPPPPPKPALIPGRWDPAVKKALEDMIEARGKAAPGYDAQKPPIAVFPWSGAAIVGDPTYAVFVRQVDKVEFKINDAFWSIVPLAYGRQRLRADYETFSVEPQSTWPRQSYYQQYRKALLKAYQDMCDQLGRKECRAFIVNLCAGYGESELRDYARQVIDDELAAPQEEETVRIAADDRSPVRVPRGIRPVPEMQDLIVFLIKAGFDVWVVADESQWALEAEAKDLGVDPSRVAGIKLPVDHGKLGNFVPEPVPVRGGKVDAIVSAIGRAPVFVVGTDRWDLEMLSYGEGTRLILDKGDAELRAAAAERHWLVQPSFAAGLAKAGTALAPLPADRAAEARAPSAPAREIEPRP